MAQPLGPFVAAVDTLRIGRVRKPQRRKLGHQRADRVLAGFHREIGPRAAVFESVRPVALSARPALALERPDHAGLHETRLADAGVAHQRDKPTRRGDYPVEDVGGLAVAAEEEIGVLLLQRDKAAIGIDGAPGLGRLRHLARLQGRHDLRKRLRRGGFGALDPMELSQSRQVGGRPLWRGRR